MLKVWRGSCFVDCVLYGDMYCVVYVRLWCIFVWMNEVVCIIGWCRFGLYVGLFEVDMWIYLVISVFVKFVLIVGSSRFNMWLVWMSLVLLI